MATESRTIQPHPKLLFDVITRQAGTLGKAVLEGIMNSVDAKATFCDITLFKDRLVIKDDGEGIKDRKSIEDFFETFGTPHDASEGKIYGTFRMGRGQIFSFGRNFWRTSQFKMDVDIKVRGLKYELESELEPVKGCTIEVALYKELFPYDLNNAVREITKMAKYAPVAVALNGERISVDPSAEEWDVETNEAYIRMTSSTSLSVYNLGVWVKDFGNYEFGCGGTVVSKKQLTLNFARNDIMVGECAVWKKVRKFVDLRATQKNKDKVILDDGERQRLADQIRNGELGGNPAGVLKLFTDVDGRHWSANKIARSEVAARITSAPTGDMRGDKLMQSKIAFVFSNDTLERFNTNLKGLVDIVKGCGNFFWNPKVVLYADAVEGISTTFVQHDRKEWKPREVIFEKLFDMCHTLLSRGVDDNRTTYCGRRFCVGSSDSCQAWTDGCSYVTFDRRFLSRLDFDYQGLTKFFNVALHEYCHGSPSSNTHVHEFEFYKLFHDNRDNVVYSVERTMGKLPDIMASMDRKLSLKIIKAQDRMARVEAAAKKHSGVFGVGEKEAKKEAPIAASVDLFLTAKSKLAVSVPTPVCPSSENPYRASSGYGVLFALASGKHWVKQELLAAVSASTGKSVDLVANDFAVLTNPNHRSNNARSKAVKDEAGNVRIVKV